MKIFFLIFITPPFFFRTIMASAEFGYLLYKKRSERDFKRQAIYLQKLPSNGHYSSIVNSHNMLYLDALEFLSTLDNTFCFINTTKKTGKIIQKTTNGNILQFRISLSLGNVTIRLINKEWEQFNLLKEFPNYYVFLYQPYNSLESIQHAIEKSNDPFTIDHPSKKLAKRYIKYRIMQSNPTS